MSDDRDLPLTPEDVALIVAALEGSAFTRLELSTPRFDLKVARESDGGWNQSWTPIRETLITETVAVAIAVEADDGTVTIRSPLPGTFYRAPQPGAAPFVEVGDRVEPDRVVAIIETMKLMNPVHAGVSGEIVAILPENGEAIDAEQVLMRVRPGQ